MQFDDPVTIIIINNSNRLEHDKVNNGMHKSSPLLKLPRALSERRQIDAVGLFEPVSAVHQKVHTLLSPLC